MLYAHAFNSDVKIFVIKEFEGRDRITISNYRSRIIKEPDIRIDGQVSEAKKEGKKRCGNKSFAI